MNGKKAIKKTHDFLQCIFMVCSWLAEPLTVHLKTMWSPKILQAPPSAGNKMISGRFCHGLPFISGKRLSTFRSNCRDVGIEFDFRRKFSTNTRRSKQTVISCVDAECEESLTPRDVCLSILQAHIGFINGKPFTSESYERDFDGIHEGTYEHSYQLRHKSNIGLNKAIRDISSTADQSITSNQNTLVAKQNETQSEDWSDGNRNHTGTKN